MIVVEFIHIGGIINMIYKAMVEIVFDAPEGFGAKCIGEEIDSYIRMVMDMGHLSHSLGHPFTYKSIRLYDIGGKDESNSRSKGD